MIRTRVRTMGSAENGAGAWRPWEARVSPGVLLAMAFAGWSLYGLLSTAQSFVYMAARGNPRPLSQVAGTTFVMMWFWALLTPVIFLLSLRFPLRRGNLARAVPVHLALILVLPLLDALARQLVYPWFGFDLAPVLAVYIRFFDVSFYAYLAIAAVAHVLAMSLRLQEEAVAKSEVEAALARSQVAALKTQIQPHFLFNTLHGLSETVHEDPERADRMITRLGDLLRATMETTEAPVVPLRQELDLVEKYLSIQQLRFEDRLSVDIQADAEVLDLPVPGFLLQPLVENAVLHGIAPRKGGGRVEVRAARAPGLLRIEVRDDGVGLPRDVAEGIGLGNARARLRQLYGSRASLELSSGRDGVGTSVVVELPA